MPFRRNSLGAGEILVPRVSPHLQSFLQVVAALDAFRIPYRVVECDLMKLKQVLRPPHTVPHSHPPPLPCSSAADSPRTEGRSRSDPSTVSWTAFFSCPQAVPLKGWPSDERAAARHATQPPPNSKPQTREFIDYTTSMITDENPLRGLHPASCGKRANAYSPLEPPVQAHWVVAKSVAYLGGALGARHGP